MTFTIAGIGSRKTPQNIIDEMKKIGEWCKTNSIIVHSGHADGADWAFEQGAQEACVAFVPWKTFNNHLISKAQIIVPPLCNESRAIAMKFHPNYFGLLGPSMMLMQRNGYQILGKNLKTPVNAVVCWTKNGKAAGGTGQGIRIAEAYNIPIINMFNSIFSTSDLVIKKLIYLGKI